MNQDQLDRLEEQVFDSFKSRPGLVDDLVREALSQGEPATCAECRNIFRKLKNQRGNHCAACVSKYHNEQTLARRRMLTGK